MSRDWDFRVRGSKRGHLLLETTHKGQASMEIEVSAWRTRMERGEVDLIEVIDMRPLGTLTKTIRWPGDNL